MKTEETLEKIESYPSLTPSDFTSAKPKANMYSGFVAANHVANANQEYDATLCIARF